MTCNTNTVGYCAKCRAFNHPYNRNSSSNSESKTRINNILFRVIIQTYLNVHE